MQRTCYVGFSAGYQMFHKGCHGSFICQWQSSYAFSVYVVTGMGNAMTYSCCSSVSQLTYIKQRLEPFIPVPNLGNNLRERRSK